MKIGFGIAFAVIGLVILASGAKRSRATLIAGVVAVAFGAYLAFFGIQAWRVRKVVGAMIAAAGRGDLATVRQIADDVPLAVNGSQTINLSVKWPLTEAARGLHADVVEFLLSRGAIADAQTDDGSTALHEAGETRASGDEKIAAKRVATMKALLGHGAKIDARDNSQRTPLMTNAHDAKAVALLIEQHAEVKARDSSDRTALHYAVTSFVDHSGSAALLIDHGAEVNARDRSGETPLMVAGNAEDLETLIARGADPQAVDNDGQTALHHAARTPNNLFADLDVLGVLCASGLRPDARDRAGTSPLSLARAGLAGETSASWIKGRERIVKFLSPGGPCTALSGATKERRQFVVAGAKCDEDSMPGCSALAWAYDTGKGTGVDHTRAAEIYEKACRLGSLASCTNLAYDLDHGEGIAADRARALTLYEKTCDAGGMRACLNLGLMISSGRGTPKDPARAAALFRRACDGGESDACERVGK